MKKLEFKVKLEGKEGSSVAWLNAPFDVEKLFGTRARVPVRGTINGFPFRTSLMPMGGCHGMAVNKTMRDGAGVAAGDTVSIVMERDRSRASRGSAATSEERTSQEQDRSSQLAKALVQPPERNRAFDPRREAGRNPSSPSGESHEHPQDRQEMDRLGPQAPHHFPDIVLLKKADRGNASRTRVDGKPSILERDATQGNNRNLLSGKLRAVHRGRWVWPAGASFFPKTGANTAKSAPVGGRAGNLSCGMTRNTDQRR